jgi:Domain of unknown function (DUF4124)
MLESTMRQTVAVTPRLMIAACVLIPPVAGADVYKCAGERGIPVYQEMPCGQGKELRNFQLDPPEITILPAPRAGTPASGIKEAPARNAKSDKNAKPAPAGPPAGNAAERRHVRLGMAEGEVLAKLGHPDTQVGGKNASSPRWTYLPAPGDPETVTTLTFAKGIVVDIERKVVKK